MKTTSYEKVLEAAQRLPPGDRFNLAKSLLSDEALRDFWDEWDQNLATHGAVASDEEIDELVAEVRSEK